MLISRCKSLLGTRLARVALLGVTLAAGCGGARGDGFGDGRGFGLQPANAKAAGPADTRSVNWDVRLAAPPKGARITESPDSWSIASDQAATPSEGQFLFMVLRNPQLDGQSPRAVAGLLRDDEVSRGVDASDITDAEFMGLPAAMYISFPDAGIYTVTLLAVSRKCVYVLNVTRSGDQQSVADYFGNLVALFDTYDGGPADAPACR